jgi:starvation-inducible outer membrane lipoprotein
MGIALEREGEEGRVYLYHNGFLQAWEYEDTTIKGKTTRAYGRQWVKILV